MPPSQRAPRPAAPQPRAPLLEVDFGDTELVVREHPDGLFTVHVDDQQPLVVNAEQMQQIIGGFMQIGKAKGWT
jgi:hypothetical protein